MNRRQIIIGAGATLLGAPAFAHDFTAGTLKIGHPWSRPALAGQNGVGYMTITSSGPADTLTGVVCAAAAKATLHHSMMMSGVMQMHAVPNVPIPAGKTVVFKPGGLHVMLEGLKRPLNLGDKVPATLVFAKAGRVAIEFSVQAAAPAGQPAGTSNMPGMNH